ncbi:MAG: M23 family metallopeptidase [Bacteroidales bacterium]|nr:M23 family metallopeptidase [Bacteroidales bacterium]
MNFNFFDKAKREKLIQKLRNKYQLTIHNINTLEEVLTFRLSRLNVFTYVGFSVIIISILISFLFIFTPLNLLLPIQRNSKLSRQLAENTIKLDSLENEILIRDRYFENIRNIMHGKQVDNFEELQDTSFRHENLEFSRSKHDSILRRRIDMEEKQSLGVIENKAIGNVSLKNIHFFMPVKGIVTNKFNIEEKHFGIDIVSQLNEPVLATLEGTVTIATWSLNTGYIIQVQHAHNIISIYKHNSSLLKKEGDHVTAGEPIAIIGNTGELSTGPHLHFELWHNGTVINPEDYIAF